MTSFSVSCLSFILALASGAPALADPGPQPRYYILLFGGQADVWRPTTAHVWATYVKATGQPDGTQLIEETTISWLPVAGKIRPLAWRAEPGRNYTFAETFEFMGGPRKRLALWGPYEIAECRYQQAARHKAVLDSGVVKYKVNDWFDRHDDIQHCLHGLTAAHPDLYSQCHVVRGIGESATAPVAASMVKIGMIADPNRKHDWLIPALGLDTQNLVRRTAGDGVLFPR